MHLQYIHSQFSPPIPTYTPILPAPHFMSSSSTSLYPLASDYFYVNSAQA